MDGETWGERRDRLASEWEQHALSLLQSRNPIAWFLAYRFARVARGIRAMEISVTLEDIGAMQASIERGRHGR